MKVVRRAAGVGDVLITIETAVKGDAGELDAVVYDEQMYRQPRYKLDCKAIGVVAWLVPKQSAYCFSFSSI